MKSEFSHPAMQRAFWAHLLRQLRVALFTAALMHAAVSPEASLDGAAPKIAQQPAPTLVREGGTLNLTVQATGTAPLAYTWFHERTAIQDSNTPDLVVEDITSDHAGLYWVIVSNAWGRVGSDGTLVSTSAYAKWEEDNRGNGHGYEFVQIGGRENDWRTVFDHVMSAGGYLVSFHSPAEEAFVNSLAPPTGPARLLGLIQGPAPREPNANWIWMSGEPVSYVNWNLEQSEPNNGAGLNPRGFENMTGVYPNGTWNDIHGGLQGYIIEYPHKLVLYQDLPPDPIRRFGDARTALQAGAASQLPLSYRWFRNNEIVEGATGPELPIAEALPAGGAFHVEVTDGVDTIVSRTANLFLGPIFLSSPADQIVYEGQMAKLAVEVSGLGPFTYRWYRNDVPLTSTSPELILPSVSEQDEGAYSLEVAHEIATLRSPAMQLVVLAPWERQILFDSFENGADSGWSLPVTTVPPVGGKRFLGEFGAESVSLTLTNLPAHSDIEVQLDLIIRGFWQGASGSDTWTISTDESLSFWTTFSSTNSQHFPSLSPRGTLWPAGTGATERNRQGYELVYSPVSILEDSRYRIRRTFAHSDDNLVLNFAGNPSNPAEAAWSLDNVTIIASTLDAVRISIRALMENGQLEISLRGRPGFEVDLQTSSDLDQWTSVGTVASDSGEAVTTISLEGLASPAFFRAVAEQ